VFWGPVFFKHLLSLGRCVLASIWVIELNLVNYNKLICFNELYLLYLFSMFAGFRGTSVGWERKRNTCSWSPKVIITNPTPWNWGTLGHCHTKIGAICWRWENIKAVSRVPLCGKRCHIEYYVKPDTVLKCCALQIKLSASE
jgi:hypothetical protein